MIFYCSYQAHASKPTDYTWHKQLKNMCKDRHYQVFRSLECNIPPRRPTLLGDALLTSSSRSLLHPVKVATHSIYSQALPILLRTSSNTGRRVKHYCSEGRPLLLRAWSNSACTSDLYSFFPPSSEEATDLPGRKSPHAPRQGLGSIKNNCYLCRAKGHPPSC